MVTSPRALSMDSVTDFVIVLGDTNTQEAQMLFVVHKS
mgnify:CR=1 FL=1